MISGLGWGRTVSIIPSRRSCGGPKFMAPQLIVPRSCSGGSSAADQLKSQLHLLRHEAEATRSKAQNARLRLLRLSEAAEKLRRRAAVDIQSGREDEARELLLQKKKIMKAWDRSKNRIELLDELSSKIAEAMSLKEAQLIENLAQMEFGAEKAEKAVHIISPSESSCEEDANASKSAEEGDSNRSELVNSISLIEVSEEELNDPKAGDPMGSFSSADVSEDEADAAAWEDLKNLEVKSRFLRNGEEEEILLEEISCFDDFLRNIDGRLREVEADLSLILKSSALLMGEEEKQSVKVQQARQILADICRTRSRIASIINAKSEDPKPEPSA